MGEKKTLIQTTLLRQFLYFFSNFVRKSDFTVKLHNKSELVFSNSTGEEFRAEPLQPLLAAAGRFTAPFILGILLIPVLHGGVIMTLVYGISFAAAASYVFLEGKKQYILPFVLFVALAASAYLLKTLGIIYVAHFGLIFLFSIPTFFGYLFLFLLAEEILQGTYAQMWYLPKERVVFYFPQKQTSVAKFQILVLGFVFSAFIVLMGRFFHAI